MTAKTVEEKSREYRQLADQAIDYVYSCAKYGRVPLVHDANVFRARLTAVDKARVAR